MRNTRVDDHDKTCDLGQEPSARQAESCLVSLLQSVVQVVSLELSNELFLMLLG